MSTVMRVSLVLLDRRAPRRIQQPMRYLRPPQAFRPAPITGNAHIAREFEIGQAIADHRRARAIPTRIGEVIEHEPDLRLARVALLPREMAVDADGLEADALAGKDLQHEIVRRPEIGFWKTVRPEAILVGDHHQRIARIDDAPQCRNYIRQEFELGDCIDLLIGRFFDEAAVAVDEEDLAAHSIASRNRAFSSGVPMLTRRQFANPR